MGNGTSGYCCDGGPATAANINFAYGIAKDGLGNLYISDWNSHRVRKINALGIITTVVGTGIAGESGDGGPATAAQIGWPYGLATDAAGNLYITDWYYYRIRKVTPAGIITTIAGNGTGGFSGDGGPATAAQIGNSWGIATDAAGNVYFSDYSNWRIRKINTSGIISTIAGNGTGGYSGDGGPAVSAQLGLCYGIAADNTGNVYITQWNQGRVRRITPGGIISTFAGTGTLGFSGDGGPATAAKVNNSYSVSADAYGNLFMADFASNRIRRITPTGTIFTIGGTGATGYSGDGGPATAATFNTVFSIGTDASSDVYVSDYFNSRVRMILGNNRPPAFTGGHTINVSVCANTTYDSLNIPLAAIDSDMWQLVSWSVVTAPHHGTAYISYLVPSTGGVMTPYTLAYTPTLGYSGMDTFKVRVSDGYSADTATVYMTINPSPSISGSTLIGVGTYSLFITTLPGGVWSSGSSSIASVGSTGMVTGVAPGTTTISYTLPSGCGKTVTVNVFAFAGQMITTIAGNGTAGYIGDGGNATSASINNPYGVAADATGNVYIADNQNNRIRKVNPSGIITTIAGTGSGGYSGDGGPATAADLFQPWDVTVDGAGNIYFADMFNSRIRKISTAGIITTVAGNGTFGYFGDGGMATLAYLNAPCGVAVDASGNLYICDGYNHCIRKVNTSGVISTIAGNGTAGYGGDGGMATAALLNSPSRVATDGAGNVYISDMGNHRVRIINASGIISTYTGTGVAGFAGDGGMASVALVNAPHGLAVDPIGNVFLGDTANNRVRRVNTFGVINTLAGNGTAGYSGDHCMATASSFNPVSGIAIDAAGGIYIADANNNRIRKITFNHAPYFTGGHTQSLSVCQNSIDTISSLLGVGDVDQGQTEVWSIALAPAHGTLSVSYTATITSGTVTPVGLLYSPTIGYTGPDSFKVQVTDCTGGADTTTVYITVTPPPSAIAGAPNVCAGLTTLYVNPIGPGIWSSSNPVIASVGSASGVVTGVAAGIATITFAPGAGCSVTKTITVNPSPAAVTGSAILCIGIPVTFTDATSGGVWSSSNSSVAAVGSTTGIVMGITTGTATISYVQAGCPALLPVTVNAVPPPVTGVTNVCVGSSTVLFCAGGGSWSSSNPAVGSIDPYYGMVTGLASGTTVITYTIASGCASMATVNVFPVPLPVAGSSIVCTGQTITLTDATAGGVWSTPGIAIAASIDSATGVVTGITTGTATILYTLISTGCSASFTVSVNPSPAAVTGSSGVCLGNTITLSDLTPGGTWGSSSLSVATVGPTSGVVSGISVGVTTISYMTGACWATKVVTVNPYPLIISVSGHVCTGDTTTATDPGGGTWSSLTPTIAGIGPSTGLVTGISAGTATIDYTLPTGCAITTTLTVNGSPVSVTGPSTICAGGLSVFTDGTPGGTWSSSNTLVAVVGPTTGFVSGASAGVANISYVLGTGCYAVKIITVNPTPSPITGMPYVCTGATTTLSDVTTGGIWTSGGTSIATVTGAGVVNGASVGVVNISYTAGGCSVTRSVTVSATPTAISGPATVCAGTSVTETDLIPGGIWSTSSSLITIGSSSGVVNGIAVGAGAITYTVGASGPFAGCSVARVMTVNPASAITGPSGVCIAASIPLSAAGTGTWSSSNPLIASVGTSGTVAGVAVGTATITFNLSGGCATTKSVTVNTTPTAITGFAGVCPGTHTTLYNGAGGGTWASSNLSVATIGSSSGYVTGVALGTVTISYSLGSGCTVTTVVTVNTPPSPVTGSSNVCAGSSVTLSDATPGGSWSSGSPLIASVGSSSGLVAGIYAGTAVISYTPASTGCSATMTVTVNPLPLAITGTMYVCASLTTTLSDTTPGGAWSSSTLSVATIGSSGIITGVMPGTDTIRYTLPTGCRASAVITVNPAPAPIAGSMMTCIGGSATLSDLTTGGSWTSGTPSVATIGPSTGIVTGATVGTSVITYFAGGCYVTSVMTINPLPAVITGPSHVCAGGATISLADATPGGVWSSSAPSIATAGSSTGIITGVAFGFSTISYSLGVGCTVTSVVDVWPIPSAILGAYNVCPAATALMTDPMPGGAWSSSVPAIASIDTAGLVTGVSGGTALISYTSITTGCAATHNITVPVIPSITGLASMCAWGDTIIVHDADTTGSYSSTLVTVINLGGGIGKVVSHAPGTATVSYALPSGCVLTVQVTVNPLPPPISGTTNLCIGAAVTMTDASTGGTWSSGNLAVATIGSSSGALSALSAGVSRISYTLPTGCKIDTLVTVSTFPFAGSISGAGSVCMGQTITLTDTAMGGVWSSGTTSIATAGYLTGIVTGLTAGTVTISYTIANPCGSASATKPVNVNPIPDAGIISGPDSVCVGEIITLIDTVSGGVWANTNGTAAVSAVGTVTGVSPGTDTITYTRTIAGCIAQASHAVRIIPLSLCHTLGVTQPQFADVMNVWPNPNSGSFNIELVSTRNETFTIIISNAVGQKVGELDAVSNHKTEVKMNVAMGIYFISAVTSGGAYNVKMEIR